MMIVQVRILHSIGSVSDTFFFVDKIGAYEGYPMSGLLDPHTSFDPIHINLSVRRFVGPKAVP